MYANFNTTPVNPASGSMFPNTANTFSNPPMNQPMNTGFQTAPISQPLLPNIDERAQFCQKYLQKVFNQIVFQQQNPDFQTIYTFIDNDQKSIINQLQQCTKIEKVTQLEQEYLKKLRERCLRLKYNNQTILKEMFNVKQKFSRILAPVMDKNFQKEEEFSILKDRIRRMSLDISNKLNHLKNKKLFDQANSKNKQKNTRRFAPISIALTQLKDATELINRQLIKQREQIRMLVKQLYNENI